MTIAERFNFSPEDLARIAALDPRLAEKIAAGLEYDVAADERERCEGSLIEFFACAWPQFDPAPVKINWHHELIAEHLEAVTRGEIRKLLISVPPRCSKTSLVNCGLARLDLGATRCRPALRPAGALYVHQLRSDAVDRHCDDGETAGHGPLVPDPLGQSG